MVFSSALFLFAFFPVVFFAHLLIKDIRARNILLLAASLFFYSVGEPVYVALMAVSIALNYFFGVMICRSHAKAWVAVGITVDLAILAVFKYTDFIISIINAALKVNIPFSGIGLPIGISFFTFQAMSYIIDVYRDRSLVQRNVLKLALYISFFPQLIAGPIIQYSDIAAEIDSRTVTADGAAEGLRRFIIGLAKKIIIANTVGYAADFIFGMNGGSVIPAWAGVIFYCLQIYYDFSGYSDMAIGLGRMFGFRFKENFDHPYSAVSLKDFWRRWHISLSSWFRDYVYIPLGGNRKGETRATLNRFFVFFITGLWHGASLNFVIWGLLHGVFTFIESAVAKRIELPRIVTRVYALLVAALAFVFFRAETLGDAAEYFMCLFSGHTTGVEPLRSFITLLNPWTIAVTAVGIIFTQPVLERIPRTKTAERLSYIACFMLLVVCVLNLASSSFNPFIYFRF